MACDNDKFAVPLADGSQVEAVWYPSGTLCLSTQVGCAMGCPYCASGRDGLQRSLTAEELAAQVALAIQRGHTIERLTLSGIGEPLQALETVTSFMANSTLPVSVTTTGQPLTALKRMLPMRHNGVMLSLHAGTPATHKRMVPRGPSLDALCQTLAELWPQLSRRQRRKIGINYLVLAGINDGDSEVAALVGRLQLFPEITVHLLYWNEVAGPCWRSPSPDAMVALRDRLRGEGIHVRLANRWRRQAQGGCGTLLSRQLDK